MARPRGRALEQQRIAKEEKKEAARKQASRRNLFIGLGVAALLVGGATVFLVTRPPDPWVTFPDLGNEHMAPGQTFDAYNSAPPSSGPHIGSPLPGWGVHDEPVEKEYFVHSLEDSGVVLTYDCPEGCEDMVAELTSVTEEFSGQNVLLTPYTGIVDPDGAPRRGAAAAWTKVFYFDQLDEETRADLVQFIRLYEGIDHHVSAG